MPLLQFWDPDGSGKVPEKGFDFFELEFRSTGDSIAQQKVRSENSPCTNISHLLFQERFDKTVAPIILELKMKYPVGNHTLFPDQRVYKDAATGWFYDL